MNKNPERNEVLVIDMHAHTTASDGTYTPAELVQLAKGIGLQAVAITDHDIVTGYLEAVQEGNRLGVEVIPGVEISTFYQGSEIHLLGYYINSEQPALLSLLEKNREVRQSRNEALIKKLNQLGIAIDLEEVRAKKADGDNVGRPHIAEVLIDKGAVTSMSQAFEEYIGVNGKAYVAPSRISTPEAIRYIQESGGVAVIAHPGIYQNDDVLIDLVRAGLDGIEVNHPDHSETDHKRYEEFAKKHALLMTAGSDFHGERNGSVHHAPLGTCTITKEQLQRIKEVADVRG